MLQISNRNSVKLVYVINLINLISYAGTRAQGGRHGQPGGPGRPGAGRPAGRPAGWPAVENAESYPPPENANDYYYFALYVGNIYCTQVI